MSYTETQRRQHIMELQRYLHALGVMDGSIPVILPDGLYGPETAGAVRAFQETQGLPVTGTADTVTWRRIVGEYRRLMCREPLGYCPLSGEKGVSQGDRGTAVYVIQAMLLELSERFDNIPAVEVSGEYTADTVAAVKYFQQLTGLPLTGRTDNATWNMMVMVIRN